MNDRPPQRRPSNGGFAVVRTTPAASPASTPPQQPVTTDTHLPQRLRSDPGVAMVDAPAPYDGRLTPVAPPVAPAVTTAPSVATAPSAAMTAEMSAALGGLKRVPSNPARSDPTSQPPAVAPSFSLPPPPSPSLPAAAPAESEWGSPVVGVGALPRGLTAFFSRGTVAPAPAKEPRDWRRLLRRAGVAVAAVAVVAGAWVVIRAVGADGVGGGSASGGSASGTLDDAVRCKQTLVRGRDLICVTPPSTLTDLPPAERDARLARARALAVLAGMNRIIFEYNGRIWRTLVLTAPQGTTTTAPSGTPATATPGPAGTPVSSPSPPASPVGPVDTTAP